MTQVQKSPMTQNPDIQSALRVLNNEIDGLEQLRESIGESFTKAIDIIHNAKTKTGHPGRLIVAGMGKSGHVARKMAATLASTGTPSYFVHPGEASHGDMGMITNNDVVLLLSNSGESAELSDLIHYTRRFKIPMISMTNNPESTLGSHSDICLQLPKIPEACPNGLAPTTSTTMMMALGDAIAVALLERMGLTPEQFHVFHPGGKLGQRLLTVADLMIKHEDLPLVSADTKMDEALIAMTEKNVGLVIITKDNGALAGIITDGDLKRHMAPDLLQKSVTDIMTSNPRNIASTSLGAEAMEIMTSTPGKYLTSLVVMDDGKLKGLIRLQDCLQAGLA